MPGARGAPCGPRAYQNPFKNAIDTHRTLLHLPKNQEDQSWIYSLVKLQSYCVTRELDYG